MARWRTVRFGDVVRQSRASVDPATSELTRYVAGEHMDTDNLRIRRWGTVGDGYLGPAFHRRFSSGQVLYGSRRTYLRKVAVPDFDGICANTTLVMEAANDELAPGLLPFVMQMERFHNHSNAQSKGSVNPYVNWSDLAWFRFKLPEADEQHRLAGVLSASTACIARLEDGLAAAEAAQRGYAAETFARLERSGNGRQRTLPLGELLQTCQYGLSTKASDSGGVPIFRMMNLADGVVVENDLKYVDLSDEELAAYELKPGDLLFNRTNSSDLVGKVGIYRLAGRHVFASYLMRLRAVESVEAEYLNAFLNSAIGQQRVRSFATHGVSQANINATNLRKVRVPVPAVREQLATTAALSQLRTARDAVAAHLASTRSLHRALVARLLETDCN
jgi:type I restriction enzyme S subunit